MSKYSVGISLVTAIAVCCGIAAFTGPGVSSGEIPQLSVRSAVTPLASPPPAEPSAVLWDQYNNYSGTDFAAQLFGSGYETYDIYAGDDFANDEPWIIQTITTRGGWGYFVDLMDAAEIHWYIYEDAGGEPAGVPGDANEYWSISLPPTDSQVALGVNEPEDVVLTLSEPVTLPPGTWWLVYFVDLEYASYGQYGWSGTSDPAWGNIGEQNNPGGGFGLPPGWNPNSYDSDYMFRLEGELSMPWNLCFYDENYSVVELWISLMGTVFHGQALYEADGFPAAITGKVYNGKAFFSIDYLDNLGLRFYMVDIATRSGTTWGVYSGTGEFYDMPHSAQLHPCGSYVGSAQPRTGLPE